MNVVHCYCDTNEQVLGSLFIQSDKELLQFWPGCNKNNFIQMVVPNTLNASSVDGSVPYRWSMMHSPGLDNLLDGVVVSIVWRMNKVTLCWSRLVLGWVTSFGRVCHLDM